MKVYTDNIVFPTGSLMQHNLKSFQGQFKVKLYASRLCLDDGHEVPGIAFGTATYHIDRSFYVETGYICCPSHAILAAWMWLFDDLGVIDLTPRYHGNDPRDL